MGENIGEAARLRREVTAAEQRFDDLVGDEGDLPADVYDAAERADSAIKQAKRHLSDFMRDRDVAND